MNATTYLHLLWKEYRSARLFWLSIVLLVVLIQWFAAAVYHPQSSALGIIYNFALGAPAFFAIGCAGAAFAAEREEGTYEFLRSIPVSSGQIFASKLTLVLIATVAMFAVLWPIALMFSAGQLPESTQLNGMLGLWLMGAAEAIAWGTLFSLLGARPLLAVVLAMAAASTGAHVLAWTAKVQSNLGFEWLSYLRAIPSRLVVAALVFGLDVYLGLRWLHGGVPVRKLVKRVVPVGLATSDNRAMAGRLLGRRDRSTMLGRLLWQQSRQSAWLVIFMTVLFVALGGGTLPWLASGGVLRLGDLAVPWTMAVLASLIGSMVFLSDQERQRYRFFAEHNVPPRYVWFTRQFPWIATLLIATLIVCCFWFGYSGFRILFDIVEVVTNPQRFAQISPYYSYLYLPPFGVGLAFVAVAYASGQWMSMLVRSGIMAGFLGLLLSGALCGWVLLMYTMQLSFLWTVWPIPLLLLWATWLRAPDWICENKRWSARLRAGAPLLVPAALLLVAVPVYRVHQLPLVSPGFDPARFALQISKEALATAELYRKANDMYESPVADVLPRRLPGKLEARGTAQNSENVPQAADQRITITPEERVAWLKTNAKTLELLLEASRSEAPVFANPTVDAGVPRLRSTNLIQLVLASGRHLEEEGKLDEALDRYLSALHISCQLAESTLLNGGRVAIAPAAVFAELTAWGSANGQTPEQIRGAIAKLETIKVESLRLDAALQFNYVLQKRAIFGDGRVQPFEDSRRSKTTYLWNLLMPWERFRALRALNLATETSILYFQNLVLVLNQGANGVIAMVSPTNRDGLYDSDIGFQDPYRVGIGRQQQVVDWLETTHPNPWPTVLMGSIARKEIAEFEARRRGAMLVLALQGYRLEHGALPESLDTLKGDYFRDVPRDPYHNREFQYFPNGIVAVPRTYDGVETASPAEDIRTPSIYWQRIVPAVPCVWCSGPDLIIHHIYDRPANEPPDDPTQTIPDQGAPTEYYTLRGDYLKNILPYYQVWEWGYWFPIPNRQP